MTTGTGFRILSIVAAALVLCLAFSTLGSFQKASPEALSSADVVALLDPERGSIVLPLDAYGMSPGEQQTVLAAQAAVFWPCVEQSDALSAAALENINRLLSEVPIVPDWTFGFWSAPLLATHGPIPMSRWVPPGAGAESPDPNRRGECWSSPQLASLEIVDRSWVARPPVDRFVRYGFEAMDQTIADPRFQRLLDARSTCVQEKGYSVNEEEMDTVVTEESWTEEERLEAFLAEATCSDQQNFTQQVADIAAEYELEIINDHEAQLIEVKRLADETVAEATRILRDAGVI